MNAIIIGGCLIIAPLAHGQPINVGDTEFPLGESAFATSAECLDLDDGCGGDIAYLGPPPLYPFYSMFGGLTAQHILEVVPTDLDDADEMRLVFSVSIANQQGPDVYLGQAFYIGGDLGLFDPVGLNDFDVSFDAGTTWYTIAIAQFVEDSIVTAQTVWYTEGEIKSAAYELWYHLLDLADYGYSPGETVSEIYIRGQVIPPWPETVGLDVVTVASLNEPRPDITGLRVGCSSGGRLKALLRTSLPEGTTLTLTNDGADPRTVTIDAQGRGRAKWAGQIGSHEVCIVEYPQFCASSACP